MEDSLRERINKEVHVQSCDCGEALDPACRALRSSLTGLLMQGGTIMLLGLKGMSRLLVGVDFKVPVP